MLLVSAITLMLLAGAANAYRIGVSRLLGCLLGGTHTWFRPSVGHLAIGQGKSPANIALNGS